VGAAPSRSATEHGDELATTTARLSPGAPDDADDVTGTSPGVSGLYVYGYDSAGNPTLTDAGYH
jgi:hypothetical protein